MNAAHDILTDVDRQVVTAMLAEDDPHAEVKAYRELMRRARLRLKEKREKEHGQ